MLPIILANILGACEEWCVHPCTELNGDVTIECSGCLPSHSCNPEADDFAAKREPKKARAAAPSDMGGGGGMGMGGRRVAVQSSGAPSLFTMPEAPREDASAFFADATVDDLDIMPTGGGRPKCHSSACARVRLQWLRNANAEALPAGGNATAGSEHVPCEFQRATREELLAMPLEERTEMLTRLPTLITGLTDGWPAMDGTWADPQAFSRRFGHHHLKAIRAGHGFGRLGRLGGPACHGFDEARCPGQANATMPLAEFVPYSDDEQIVIMDLSEMTRGEYELLTDLTTAYEPPEMLDALSNIR